MMANPSSTSGIMAFAVNSRDSLWSYGGSFWYYRNLRWKPSRVVRIDLAFIPIRKLHSLNCDPIGQNLNSTSTNPISCLYSHVVPPFGPLGADQWQQQEHIDSISSMTFKMIWVFRIFYGWATSAQHSAQLAFPPFLLLLSPFLLP